MEDKSVEIILFEQIQSALEPLLTSKSIRSVEIWNNQIDNEETERPHLYPYVAVEISTEWRGEEGYNSISEIKQNQQKGECTVTIHYIYESLYTETETWVTQRAKLHIIHRLLNSLAYDQYFTPFTRQSTPHEESHGRVSDMQIIYSTEVIECAITDENAVIIEIGAWSVESQNSLIISNDIIRTGLLTADTDTVLIGDILFTRTSSDGLEQIIQTIEVGDNNITNPFIKRIPQIIDIKDSTGEKIDGLSPKINQTTGNIEINSGKQYINAIITIIGWVV
jgi:hypothetical protein